MTPLDPDTGFGIRDKVSYPEYHRGPARKLGLFDPFVPKTYFSVIADTRIAR
jgi:hypothetical protein